MRVAVTGASGYLGTVLLPRIDRLASVDSILALDVKALPPETASLAKVRFERADVRTADFAALFRGVDAVVHLAFIVSPISDRGAIEEINVAGSRRVFEGAIAAGTKRIVYASSIASYGAVEGHPVPLVEDSPRRDQPAFYYAHTKFLVEALLDDLERRHPDVAIARIRPGVFLGPGVNNILGDLLRAPVVFGVAGQPGLQYAWDEDVADAFVLALEKGARGAFIVTGEGAVTHAEAAAILGKPYVPIPRRLVDAFARAAGAVGASEAALMARVLAAVSRATIVASSGRAKRELGWRPRLPESREVIRRFGAETSSGLPNPGVALFFVALAALAPGTGGRLGAAGPATEGAAREIAVNYELTGPGGSSWHARYSGGRVRLRPGRAAGAPTTVRMTNETLCRLLSGELSSARALETGRVHVRGGGGGSGGGGDPNTPFFLDGPVTLFRRLAAAEGWRGAPARWFTRVVLELARGPARADRDRAAARAS